MNTLKVSRLRLDKNFTVLIATGMVCATILLFGTFIWPTPYTYQMGVRINRLTGSAASIVVHVPDSESPKLTDQKSPVLTDDELIQYVESLQVKRDFRSSMSTAHLYQLALFLGIGCMSITIAILVWFRGTGAMNCHLNKAVVTLATTLRKIKPKSVDACVIQGISRREDVYRNENVEQSLVVPQSVKQYEGIRRLTYWLGLIGILVMNQVFILTTQDNPVAALFGFAIIITLSLMLVMNRLHNMGASGWLSLLILVPIANLLVGVRCAVCQEGNHDTRKLDMAGRILSWMIIGCLVFIVLCCLTTVIEVSQYANLSHPNAL